MADTDSASATVLPPNPAPLAPRKQHAAPIGSKIAELNESRTELHTRIQGLKQDLQSWRSKLDTQVKIYREVSHLGNHSFSLTTCPFKDCSSSLIHFAEEVSWFPMDITVSLVLFQLFLLNP
ncbi:hypothetical protein LINPERPRIM_LOCUS6378 [Linum perenne]